MKSPPFPPQRGRPPDWPIEPETPPRGPQGRRRQVSGNGKAGLPCVPGYPGFSRAFSPPPEKGWSRRVLWEGPDPNVDREQEGTPRRKIFRLAPGMRAGEAGSRKPGARNRLMAVDRDLRRSPGARSGPCRTTPSARKGAWWSEPGGLRCQPDWVASLEAIKPAHWNSPKRKNSVESRSGACARRRISTNIGAKSFPASGSLAANPVFSRKPGA